MNMDIGSYYYYPPLPHGHLLFQIAHIKNTSSLRKPLTYPAPSLTIRWAKLCENNNKLSIDLKSVVKHLPSKSGHGDV